MSRSAIKLLGGLVTVFAAVGAWTLGKETGRKVARATMPEAPPKPLPPDPEPGGLIEDAVEVSARSSTT